MQTSSSSNFTYINLFQNTYHPSSLSTKPRPKSVHTATIPLTSFLLYRIPQSEDFTPFKEEILKRLGLLQRQQKLADKFLIDAERWLLVQRTLTRRFHHRYQHVNFKRKLGVTAAPPSPPLLSRSSWVLNYRSRKLARGFVIRIRSIVVLYRMMHRLLAVWTHVVPPGDLVHPRIRLDIALEVNVDTLADCAQVQIAAELEGNHRLV